MRSQTHYLETGSRPGVTLQAEGVSLWTEERITYQDFGGVNYDFHMAMARLTGNEYLAGEVQHIFQRTIRSPSVNLYQEVQEEPHKYHLLLIEAMRQRDEKTALQLIEHECRRDDDPDSIF